MSIRSRAAIAIIIALLCSSDTIADGLSGSLTPQLGGGIGGTFDGGVSGPAAAASSPVTPCSQTGLIFTSGCNAILYVVLF